MLLNVAERLVPAEQVERLRTLVRRFLWASYLDWHDEAESAREFDAVREDALAMQEPSATLLKLLIERDVKRLGLALLPSEWFATWVPTPPAWRFRIRRGTLFAKGPKRHRRASLRQSALATSLTSGCQEWNSTGDFPVH